MPQRKGETQQQYMDRLRAVRGLPPLTRERLMEETRAALCYIGTARNPEQQRRLEISAFMSIFHPDVSNDRVREMMRES